MLTKLKEKMNWNRLHHLYLGLVGMIVSGFVGFKFVHDKDLLHIGPCILAGFLSALWAADDWIYHMWGIHTPCWYAEQWLLGLGWYKKLRDWLNKLFGGKPDG